MNLKTPRAIHKKILLASFGEKCHRCGLVATDENLAIWQFHHAARERKRYNVTQLLDYPDDEFESFIPDIVADCVMVCANCHALITANKRESAEIFDKWLYRKERREKRLAKVKSMGLMGDEAIIN